MDNIIITGMRWEIKVMQVPPKGKIILVLILNISIGEKVGLTSLKSYSSELPI